MKGHVVAKAVSYRFLISETRDYSKESAQGICSARSITGIGFSSSPLVFACQCYTTLSSYSLTYHLWDGQWTR
jgi:hypothetical protein